MSAPPAEYYVSKAPKPLRRMDYLRKRLQNRFLAAAAESKCYVMGILLLALSGMLAVFQRPEAIIFTQIGAFIFALGLLPLIERLYEWAWRTLLGKLFIVTLIALTTNIAYGFGRQLVAGIVGTSPEPFNATVHVATILFSPILFLLTLALGGVFIFPIATQVGTLALLHHGINKRITIWMCRFIALTIAVFGSWNLLNRSTGYSGWVERRTAAYLYTFDMYRDTQYATNETKKTALISRERILIGTPAEDGKGHTFSIQSIQSILH